MPRIKTTVTLDPDVEAALREYARRHGVSFEDALDNAIRSGLAQTRAPASRFQQKTYRLGARTGLDLNKALDLAAGLADAEILHRAERTSLDEVGT